MAVGVLHPTSFSTPNPLFPGDGQVSSPQATGHGSTQVSSSNGPDVKSCAWSGFEAHGVTPTSVILKADWSQNGSLSGGTPLNGFSIRYSLNNGASWSFLHSASNFSGSSSGADQVALSNSQDVTQVKLDDDIFAQGGAGGQVTATASVSNIRIEIEFNAPPQFMMSSMA